MQMRLDFNRLLPPIVKNLLIINGLFFVATYFVGEAMPFNPKWLAMYYFEATDFRIWQVITHMFVHADPTHILFNMFNLWMFGAVIERFLGPKKFLIFYLLCGLGAAIIQQLMLYVQLHHFNDINALYTWSVGASGAVFGLMFAFGYLFPNMLLYLYFDIPIKAKYVIAGLAAFGLFAGFSNNPGDDIAHFAHLGGMLAGFIIFVFWRIRYNSGRI